MADPILHIRDSHYFEVPKVLYPYDYGSRKQFPEVWISLDPEFQDWEFERLYHALSPVDAGLPPEEQTKHDWHEWRHKDHANFAKPYDVFLQEKYDAHVAKFNDWKAAEIAAAKSRNDGSLEDARRLTFDDYLKQAQASAATDRDYFKFFAWRHQPGKEATWQQAKAEAGDVAAWKQDAAVEEWSEKKLKDYNGQLSGKILIPQVFGGKLRNLYEAESGFAITKYMVIELLVALVLVLLFTELARRVKNGRQPKGKFWNLLEVFLVFIRDQIVRPVFGAHGHEEHDEHPAPAASHGGHAEATHAGDGHGHAAAHAAAAHKAVNPETRFLPLLWTVFFFVLGCNLMGMVPWVGAPTASFAVTLAMAAVTLLTVIVFGMIQFGPAGFFLNQIPGMDLPWYMAIFIKPMVLIIEVAGMLIKHGVLAVRLLANMVAGHLVILGIMGVAFGAAAALKFSGPDAAGWQWGLSAVIAVIASAAFSVLELFVAFLQAYVFTFLSALFIGAAIHKH